MHGHFIFMLLTHRCLFLQWRASYSMSIMALLLAQAPWPLPLPQELGCCSRCKPMLAPIHRFDRVAGS